MTDFQTLLKESIVARGIRDAAQRQTIYAQARTALIRQLADAEPRLFNAEIAKRVIEFDRAMREIESELSAEFGPEDPRAGEPEETPPPYDPEAASDPHDIQAGVNGWDAGSRGVEDEPAFEEDLPALPQEEWDGGDDTSRGAVAVRGSTGPAIYADDEEELPPAVPMPGRWKEEEAVLREDAPERPPLAPARRRLPPPQRRLGWTLSEGDKIKVLFGAIGALALVLVGLVVYLVVPGGNAGVTVPLGRGTVSDAAAAGRIATAAMDVKQSFVVFDGRDPTIFQASSDNPVRLDSDAGGAFARIGTSTASSGVKVQIGPGLASRLAGQNVRVVMDVRSASDRGALNMRFAYQSGVALSHWQTANLSAAYTSSGMTWLVPQMRTSANGSDYLIIEPGIPGDGTYADIRSIRIDLLGSSPTG